MTLTRFQIHERLGGLAGEMKAARELDRINADTLAAKEHELTLAAQAKEKSEANITRLEDEARSLASQYASSVEELIGAPQEPLAENAIASVDFALCAHRAISTHADGVVYCDECGIPYPHRQDANSFLSPLYTNGISRALEEAQNP